MKKRMLVCIYILVLVLNLLLSSQTLASGVPVLQYSTTLPLPGGDFYCSTYLYDWKTVSGSTAYYYRVVGYSSDLTSQNCYYYGALTNYNAVVGGGDGWPWSYQVYVEGNNGSGWFDMGNINIGSPSSFTFNTPVHRYRIVICISYSASSTYDRGVYLRSYSSGNVNVWMFGADQATADAAATNALSAKTSADAAKVSADAAKTSADTAASRAQTAINQTWYLGAYGGSSESVANIAGYIRCLHN